MKPFEPLRPARPTPMAQRMHAVAAALAIVAVSAGLYALGEAGVIGQGPLVWAAVILVPLTTYLTVALEWKALNTRQVERRAPPEPIDVMKLFQEDIARILASRAADYPDNEDEDRRA